MTAMITFHLDSLAGDRIAFAYSPVLEAVLSLHALIEPKHHSVQHQWVRQMQRLSPSLKREIAAFGFAYRSYFPAFLFPSASDTFPSFEAEVEQLRKIAPPIVSFEFTEALSGRRERDTLARVEDPALCDLILSHAARHEPHSVSLVRLALEEPLTLLDRFVNLLSAYWEAAFRPEWRRLEDSLASTVVQARAHLAADGLYTFLHSLWPEIRTSQETERFWLDRPHEHDVVVGPGEQLVLVPSVYVWPHVRVNCDQPWAPTLVFSGAQLRRDAEPPQPPSDLLRVLRALADDTRLRALRLIAEQPRCTQELAPLVGLSEAALSKHLRLLAGAGILHTRRRGYYVLYSLAPEHLTAVLDCITSYLAATDVGSRE
jgi:DNA-binding transcriptional ArsR family regulator